MIHHIPNQQKGEKVILILRRHVFILFLRIIIWIIAAAAPVGVWLMLIALGMNFTNNIFIYALSVLAVSIYYLYIWLFAFHSFVDYYLDVWIVSTHRIINIEQRGLFARTVSELKLSRVQDVTHELHGLFSTFLNFGKVLIQTAGQTPRFVFKQVPNPKKVALKVSKLSHEYKRFHKMMEDKDEINT